MKKACLIASLILAACLAIGASQPPPECNPCPYVF